MPTVPRLQPQVGAAPLPGVRVSPSAPAGTFGNAAPIQAANQAAGQMSEYLSELKDREDASMAQTAYSTMLKAKNRLLYDPKDGAVTRVGRNAKGVRDEYVGAFSAEAEAIEKGLANDAQRAIFRTMRVREQQELDDSLVRHEFNQGREAEKASFGALIETVQDDLIKGGWKPEKMNLMQAEAVTFARNHGFGPEQTKALLTDITSTAHVGVIRQMVAAGNSAGARAHFAEYKADIAGRDLAGVESVLEEGSVRDDSLKNADMIYSAADTLKDALGMADNIEDAKTRDLTKQRIRERYRDDEIAEDREQAGLYEKVLKELQTSPWLNPRLVLTPDEWKRLDSKYKDSLLKRSEAPAASDPQVWMDFVEQLKNDPGSVSRMSRADFETIYWSKFDRNDRARAEQIWADRGNAKKQEEFKSLYSDEERVFRVFQSTGVGGVAKEDTAQTVGKDETKREALARFRAEVDDAYKGFFHSTGKNPNDEEKQQIADRIALNWMKKVKFKRYDFGVDWMDSDEERLLGDVTEKDIKGEELDVPVERKIAYYNLAKSIGRIPQTETQAGFIEKQREIINVAWLAEQRGLSLESVKKIIENWGK